MQHVDNLKQLRYTYYVPSLEISAKKHFGQNFLVSTSMQEKVVKTVADFIDNYKDIGLVEVGPGLGDLTKHFLELGRDLYAFEIDPEAYNILKERYTQERFHLFNTDFLKEIGDIIDYTKSKNFILISNLPFNVGSRILVDFALFYAQNPFAVILQKEVGNKLIPSKSDLTFFGAWLNLYYDVSLKFHISPGCFQPSPKVYSSMVTGKPKTNRFMENKEATKRLLKGLFAQPSKTIGNNLRAFGFSTPRIQAFLEAYHLPATTRLQWTNYQDILYYCLEFFADEDK